MPLADFGPLFFLFFSTYTFAEPKKECSTLFFRDYST